jgi:hypothetical protein
MERNFTNCPHCTLLGKPRLIRPATHRTPLVTRSDARTFHLYLEESGLNTRSSGPGSEPQVYALFRYDLDPCSVKAESTLVMIPDAGDDEIRIHMKLEEAADLLAELLARGEVPRRLYRMASGRLSAPPTPPESGMICAPETPKLSDYETLHAGK